MPDFKEFIASKGEEYKPFDPQRFSTIFSRVKSRFPRVKCVQVVGTNGKGSTSHFLAQMLCSANLKVGLFTSPHIFSFNERIVFDGKTVSDEDLQTEHQKLQKLLNADDVEAISYFEYAALIAYSYLSKRSDIVVLEAGLGGEFDATTVFDRDLLLVCEIDFDHKEFLGETIEDIASTKLRAIGSDVIVGSNKGCVFRVACEIAYECGKSAMTALGLLNAREIDIVGRHIKKLGLAKFQLQNLLLASAGAKYLGLKVDKKTLPLSAPKARFEKIAPNIIIDVGHNLACAKAVKKSMPSKKFVLVFNTLKEKEYELSLQALASKIKRVEIIPIQSERAIDKESLCGTLDALGLEYRDFEGIDEGENYLVFGSFLTVAQFVRTLS